MKEKNYRKKYGAFHVTTNNDVGKKTENIMHRNINIGGNVEQNIE